MEMLYAPACRRVPLQSCSQTPTSGMFWASASRTMRSTFSWPPWMPRMAPSKAQSGSAGCRPVTSVSAPVASSSLLPPSCSSPATPTKPLTAAPSYRISTTSPLPSLLSPTAGQSSARSTSAESVVSLLARSHSEKAEPSSTSQRPRLDTSDATAV